MTIHATCIHAIIPSLCTCITIPDVLNTVFTTLANTVYSLCLLAITLGSGYIPLGLGWGFGTKGVLEREFFTSLHKTSLMVNNERNVHGQNITKELARFKREYEGLTKNAPPLKLFQYIYNLAP